jgi:proteasome lid subunit RPN8/RPN11
MNADGFEVVSRTHDYPHRSRDFYSHYVAFGGTAGTVFVEPGLMARLRAAAAAAHPHETGGLVVGRILKDEKGAYTVLLDGLEGPASSGQVGYFTMTPELTARLRFEAAIRFPSGDIVGWWHSHTVASGFSGTDRRTQRQWEDPNQVGFLVFASGTTQAQAYLGPDAELLVNQAPLVKPSEGRPIVHQWPAKPAPRRESKGSSATGRGKTVIVPSWLLLFLGLLALAAATVLILRTISETRSRPLQPGYQHLSWSCWPADRNRYSCAAHLNDHGYVEWRTGDVVLGKGPLLTTPAIVEPTAIRVVIRDGRRLHEGGVEVLLPVPTTTTVAPPPPPATPSTSPSRV